MISIAGPRIVYFLAIDNRLAAVEQGVSGLDDRVTKLEGPVPDIEDQVRDIDYRLRDVVQDLDQLTVAAAALDEKVDRIVIALACHVKGQILDQPPLARLDRNLLTSG